MTKMDSLTDLDLSCLSRVYELAIAAEADGNLPVAALLVRGSSVVAEAANSTLRPSFHPGRHAEVEVLRLAPDAVWANADELTMYTSLEPCIMCFGAIVLHRLGRVVFGASDPLGGALSVIPHLPSYVRAKAESVQWLGPVQPERFEPLAERALALGQSHRG
jgi:tRNA(adenine34) deaminase